MEAEIGNPHVLFVTEKWCDRNPNLPLTSSEHNLFGSLATSGLAKQNRFHYDEYYLTHHQPCDAALIQFCLEKKPDLIVTSLWPYDPPCTPRLETLNLIQHRIGIPIIAIWFDTIWPQIAEFAEQVSQFTELNIVLDSTTAYLLKATQLEKWLPMWTPQDSKLFYNPGLVRDIGISFLGTTENRPDRLAGIDALKKAKIDLYRDGGQREHCLPIEEYSRILMRSQIALNFCQANKYVQCKGRIFEATLCGAMLLEAENSETAKWFEPMVEYVPFANPDDLVEKARYYLHHEAERLEIARRGQSKAEAKYTGEMFWKTIFERLKLRDRPSPEAYLPSLCDAIASYIYQTDDLQQQLAELRTQIQVIETSKFWQIWKAWKKI
jgi:hypothetical protein